MPETLPALTGPALSVVIPNYNGEALLRRNIPLVQNFLRRERLRAPIIVYDDGSHDNSVDFLRRMDAVTLIAGAHNRGFAHAVNAAVAQVRTPYFLLLNSDVVPLEGLRSALSLLKRHPKIFAVSALQTLPDGRAGGMAKPEFTRGLFRHRPAMAGERGVFPVLYASGGAALFTTRAFLRLGGFDPLFAPYYWEDADLGWRGWLNNFQSVCSPELRVLHDESRTISQTASTERVRRVGIRNMFLFNWRALYGARAWFWHFAWLPLHLIYAAARGDAAFLRGFFEAFVALPRLHRPPRRVKQDFFALLKIAGAE